MLQPLICLLTKSRFDTLLTFIKKCVAMLTLLPLGLNMQIHVMLIALSIKGKKRKRASKSASGSSTPTPSKGSAKVLSHCYLNFSRQG